MKYVNGLEISTKNQEGILPLAFRVHLMRVGCYSEPRLEQCIMIKRRISLDTSLYSKFLSVLRRRNFCYLFEYSGEVIPIGKTCLIRN
jgi:hypothetical protein